MKVTDKDLTDLSAEELESLRCRILVIQRERDNVETPLNHLVNAVQASATGSIEFGIATPFKELVLLRVTLLDQIVRH